MMQLPDSQAENIQADTNNDSFSKFVIFNNNQWIGEVEC